LDIPALKYAIETSSINTLALTKLDVLSGYETIKVCVGYEGRDYRIYHTDPLKAGELKPIYEELPGWKEDLTAVRSMGDLPKEAQDYIAKVQEWTGLPIKLVTTGPSREQSITL
jgi:adenylosuccinate synthase